MATAAKIPLEAIRSSAFTHTGYEPATGELDIQFPGGHIWRYFHVPEEKVTKLRDGRSAGQFFAKEIKPNHQGRLMTGECPSCGDKPGWLGETCKDCGCDPYGGEGPRRTRRPV